ncbi:MAG TPA: DNA polymerase III subunit epsilon, partial [Rudaea sp.]|nr:DNA polymerase III subunit epsilon [Rudaea sp.]
DNRHRELHGALLDAQLLADVYLAMTGGQGDLGLASAQAVAPARVATQFVARRPLRVRRADATEAALHAARLQAIDKASKGRCLWRA